MRAVSKASVRTRKRICTAFSSSIRLAILLWKLIIRQDFCLAKPY